VIGLFACLGGCPVRSDSSEGSCPLCGEPMEPVPGARPRGRPPIGDARRDQRVIVRFSVAELAALDAERGQVSRAEWLRRGRAKVGSEEPGQGLDSPPAQH